MMFKVDPVSRYLALASRGGGPLILMYHSVTPGRGKPEWIWSVAMDSFVAQVDLLRDSGWRFCKVADIARGERGMERTVAITFDDGYLDNAAAFQALADRGLPGTLFVVSASIGRAAHWKDSVTSGWQMLDAGQLRELVRSGMEIGGHSRHHCRLAETAPDQLADEIGGCRQELENTLGQPVSSFAYPYGSFNDAVIRAVADAGYEAACTTLAGPALADRDPLRLRRLAVYAHDTLSSFARKIGLRRNEATWGRVRDHLLYRTQ